MSAAAALSSFIIIGVRNDIVAMVFTNAGFITSLGVNIPYARNQSSEGSRSAASKQMGAYSEILGK